MLIIFFVAFLVFLAPASAVVEDNLDIVDPKIEQALNIHLNYLDKRGIKGRILLDYSNNYLGGLEPGINSLVKIFMLEGPDINIVYLEDRSGNTVGMGVIMDPLIYFKTPFEWDLFFLNLESQIPSFKESSREDFLKFLDELAHLEYLGYDEHSFSSMENRFKKIKEAGILDKISYVTPDAESINSHLLKGIKSVDLYTPRDNILLGLMATETMIDFDAVSYTGCAGLMQFCYSTAKINPVFKKAESSGKVLRPCCKKDEGDYKDGKFKYLCYSELKNNKFHCENDPRFDPDLSIEAGDYLLTKKIEFFKNRGYRNAEIFGITAYNVGEGNIMKAINNGNLGTDASWVEVDKELKNVVNSYMHKQATHYPLKVKTYYELFKVKQVIKELEKENNYLFSMELYENVFGELYRNS